MTSPWAFIGGGTMAQAISTGAIAAGVLNAGLIGIAETDTAKHEALRRITPNVFATTTLLVAWLLRAESAEGTGQILLAVKPQMFGSVSDELRPLLDLQGKRRVVVSILAGTTTAAIERALGPHAAVVRVMPNTPAKIRAGATAYCPGVSAHEGDTTGVTELFRAVGPLVERIDESLMDAFTAVGGSGPAYLFYLAEAMTKAAIACGFDAAAADRIVRQTLVGAGAMLASDMDQSPATLRANVTSKGGTTAAAVAVLDQAGVQDSFVHAITAARDRGRELAK